jgi:predicted AAA+ superfamily ATPase
VTDYIYRHKIRYLLDFIQESPPCGVILSGVIGSGKTTTSEMVCKELGNRGFDILRFEGDDVRFRAHVRENSLLFVNEIVQRGLERPLIFVDEVQKEPEIFDAIKMAFDKQKACFIVSGSNPAFLHTEAAHRLQRRGTKITLWPLSIPEIALHRSLIKSFDMEVFSHLLWGTKNPLKEKIPSIRRPTEIDNLVRSYLVRGGLPLAVKSASVTKALGQIKLSVERGVTETYSKTVAVADEVRRYLAFNNSREFTYQGIHQKLRSTKRQLVDDVLDHLMNHGYIFKKRPFLEEFEREKSTYLATYSWVDPGMVSYFQGNIEPNDQELGFRLEGYVHMRLLEHLEMIPVSSQIFYHKPFVQKASTDALSFKPGKLDFILQIGEHLVPAQVKLTEKLAEIDTRLLQAYLKKYNRPYAIVLYGGSPYIDEDAKIIYFPYWYI